MILNRYKSEYVFQIYKVDDISESPNCDHLYFIKHVYQWGSYKVGGMDAACHYNRYSVSKNNKKNKKKQIFGQRWEWNFGNGFRSQAMLEHVAVYYSVFWPFQHILVFICLIC